MISKAVSKPEVNSLLQPLKTIDFRVEGMRCAGCVRVVEQQLQQHPGVVSASVNLVTERATVECEPEVKPELLADSLTEAGFPTQLQSQEWLPPAIDPIEQQRQELQQQIRQVAIAAVLLLLSGFGHLEQWSGFSLPEGLSNIWLHCGLATLALLGPGLPILQDGWQGLRHRAPNMNTLISLGTLTAYLSSLVALLWPQLGWECFFDEPVMLLGFVLLGRTLEKQARGRATAALRSLVALQPRFAHLLEASLEGNDLETAPVLPISIERVRVGQWLRVLPGERIPVDGELLSGQTTVDESMVTGESMPVLKQAGDLLIAGTLNQSGAITLRATRTGRHTTLAQIIALVEAAQARKAPIQHFADQVAGYFTYGIVTIALLTFGFWYGLGTRIWPQVVTLSTAGLSHHWMMHHPVHPSPLLLSLKLAIAVLVVACPCALGLATPTALLVGSGIGAERGLLIRGGDVLERVHHLDTIVFDKTGTLTTGHPVVSDCIVLPEVQLTEAELLQLAATVESGTCHPLAVAIQAQAQQQGLSLLAAQHYQTVAGMGVSAQIADLPVWLGTADWLTQQGVVISAEAAQQAAGLQQAGKTVVYVALGQHLVGLIAVVDQLRSEAQTTVQELQQLGLRVLLLTGDRFSAALPIATALGLAETDVLAEVRPETKSQTLANLQAEGRQVAMVGDGINDAPALAQADVGISLHSATEVAIETAGIVLMGDRLSDVVQSIQLSRATFQKIRQNLFWAFGYNLLGIPIAAGLLLPVNGFSLSPAAAGAMMAFSSVSVVLNSLELRRQF